MTAPEPGVQCRNVRRTFGRFTALESIDLTAYPGQVTALVGPNGAGKTTLLLILATLLKADTGDVSVGGFDPAKDPRKVREQLGWMPDSFGTYETLTAREILEFVAAAYRLPKDLGRERADELLTLLFLADLADRPAHVLSRGQKQRLGLARALVHDPSVVLLDEPAAGLDPRSRIELRTILRDLAALGKTIIVSSHVLAELEEMADRVVFVDRGRTVGEEAIAHLGREQIKPWRLRALDPTELLNALLKLGRDPKPIGNSAEIMLDSETEAAELIANLVSHGVQLTTCAPVSGALETAYLTFYGNDPASS